MRVKNYIILAVIIVLAISMFVSGTSSTESIDAITRSSEDIAVSPLMGIKQVWVFGQFRPHGDPSGYKHLSKIRWDKDFESQLKKSGLKIVRRDPSDGIVPYDADGVVLLDIELATSEATEFAAVNLNLSFVEGLQLERIPIKRYCERSHDCITWQKSKTLILHKNDLQNGIQKLVRNMGAYFCRTYLKDKNKERLWKEHEKQNETSARK